MFVANHTDIATSHVFAYNFTADAHTENRKGV